MRIGVDIRCLMDGRRTGVEEYTLHLLRTMVRQAPQHTLVLFANSRKPMQLPSIEGNNVVLRTFQYPNALFNLSLKLLRRPTLDTLIGGVDVFFVPSVRLAPLRRAPLVLTLHDLSFIRHPESFSPDRRRWHRLMEPHRLASHAAAVVTPSLATARDVEILYDIPSERIHPVHSGLPTAADTASAEEQNRVRSRYRLPERFLLFLGTLEPRKNLDSLLQAYAAVRQAGFAHALVLAGIRGWIDDAFLARVRRHPYAPDIHLTGAIEDGDKAALYTLADIFVYPSIYEGFGFPPLEALAAGTPVVTSFNSAIPEIAGQWSTLTNPHDPQELAMVLMEKLRAPARVDEKIRHHVRQTYAWERCAQQTLAVLESAAAMKPEIRNPKSETNPKPEIRNILVFYLLVLVSSFVLRISNLP